MVPNAQIDPPNSDPPGPASVPAFTTPDPSSPTSVDPPIASQTPAVVFATNTFVENDHTADDPATPAATQPQPAPSAIDPPTSDSHIPASSDPSDPAAAPTRLLPPSEDSPAALAPPIAIGSSTYIADRASYYVVQSQTLIPGGAAITISGTPLQILPGARSVVMGSSTASLPSFAPPDPSTVVFDGQTLIAAQPSGYVLGSQTVLPGSPITANGVKVAIMTDISGKSMLAVGSSTAVIDGSGLSDPITIAGMTLTPSIAPGYNIAGHTLMKPGEVSVSGTRIALSTNNAGQDLLVVGSSTRTMEPWNFPADEGLHGPPATTMPLIGLAVTADGKPVGTLLANGDVLIAGQILTPGGQVHAGGTPVILDSKATAMVMGSSTIRLPEHIPGLAVTDPGRIFTADGRIITILDDGSLLIAGQTLAPGGQVYASRTPISLDSKASALVIGSSTVKLPELASSIAVNDAGKVFTTDGKVMTLLADGKLVIAGQTLTPGGNIYASGTPISLDPQASTLVIGSSRIQLSGIFSSIVANQILKSEKGLLIGGMSVILDASHSRMVIGSTTVTIASDVPKDAALGALILSAFDPKPAAAATSVAPQTLINSASATVGAGAGNGSGMSTSSLVGGVPTIYQGSAASIQMFGSISKALWLSALFLCHFCN